jgi:hypothetical protein
MSALEVVLAIVGLGVTAMVIVAMILLTPSGSVEVHVAGTDSQGSNLSPTPAPISPPAAGEAART